MEIIPQFLKAKKKQQQLLLDGNMFLFLKRIKLYKGESPLVENVAAKSRNPFNFSLQQNFPLLDFNSLFCDKMLPAAKFFALWRLASTLQKNCLYSISMEG